MATGRGESSSGMGGPFVVDFRSSGRFGPRDNAARGSWVGSLELGSYILIFRNSFPQLNALAEFLQGKAKPHQARPSQTKKKDLEFLGFFRPIWDFSIGYGQNDEKNLVCHFPAANWRLAASFFRIIRNHGRRSGQRRTAVAKCKAEMRSSSWEPR